LHVDPYVTAAGLLVGFTVGLTGMGGGALMTPLLVLVFKVQPLAAVSSDLVAAVIMKPVGGGVHLRRGTVNFGLVRWLMVGSVPAAFAGVLVLRQLGDGAVVQGRIRQVLGVALLLAASSIAAKGLLQARRVALGTASAVSRAFQLRPLPTMVVGMVGGLVVGAFLKLFSDHRAFRRELRELNQQLETVLDILGTVALNSGDAVRLDRVQRRVRGAEGEPPGA